jgi:hypothetical protein
VADIRAVVRRSFEMETFEPDSTEKGEWDAAYEKFLHFMP